MRWLHLIAFQILTPKSEFWILRDSLYWWLKWCWIEQQNEDHLSLFGWCFSPASNHVVPSLASRQEAVYTTVRPASCKPLESVSFMMIQVSSSYTAFSIWNAIETNSSLSIKNLSLLRSWTCDPTTLVIIGGNQADHEPEINSSIRQW